MHVKLSELRPMKKDVVVKLKRKNEVEGFSRFIVQENTEESKIQYFEVLKKSDEVTMMEVGDIIMCEWTRMTPPFQVLDDNGVLMDVGVTSQDEIIAVVEDY